jgi:hypothetical protein
VHGLHCIVCAIMLGRLLLLMLLLLLLLLMGALVRAVLLGEHAAVQRTSLRHLPSLLSCLRHCTKWRSHSTAAENLFAVWQPCVHSLSATCCPASRTAAGRRCSCRRRRVCCAPVMLCLCDQPLQRSNLI